MTGSRGLSLSGDAWSRVTSALEGTAWHSTWLDPLFRLSVPQAPGIYILHTSPKTLSDVYSLPSEVSGVLYVGQSKNLRQRLLQHASFNHNNERIKQFRSIFGRLRFSYAREPKATVMRSSNWLSHTEHILVTVLDPPANRVIPSGQSVSGRIKQAVPA